jgi:hydroxymethylglutaryl-CoA lyase
MPESPEMAEVKICDVTLRDGMQVLNRRAVIPMELRVRLAETLQHSGLPYIELGSFVNWKVIPAMADTVELITSLRPSTAELAILIPKLSYYRRLEACDPERKVATVALFVSSSEMYSQANTRMSKATAFAAAREVASAARDRGYRRRGYLSCAFRDLDPESHEMDPELVRRDCEALLEMGCDEVCLSDTDGRATPRDVERIVGHMKRHLGVESIGVHLHDRYGQGLANALVAHEHGVRIFDSSIGGIGGSRAVQNSVGNISTEELVSLFESMGVSTGVDQEQLVEAGRMIIEMTRLVGDPLPPSKLLSHRLLRKDFSGYLNVPSAARIAVSTLRDRKVTRQSRNWAALFFAVARTPMGTAAIASVVTILMMLITGLLLTQVFSVFSIVRGVERRPSEISSTLPGAVFAGACGGSLRAA